MIDPKTLFIVDGVENNRIILTEFFQDAYDITKAAISKYEEEHEIDKSH